MKKHLISTLVFLLLLNIGLKAQINTGKEFWTTFPEISPAVLVNGNPPADFTNSLFFISFYNTTVTVKYVARAGQPVSSHVVNLLAGVPSFLSLGDVYQDKNSQFESVRKNGIQILSDYPIAAYAIHFTSASSEMWPLIPAKDLGKNYITAAYREITSASNNFNSKISIVATRNNTDVTITLPNNAWTSKWVGNFDPNGISKTPGSSWTVNLDSGETYTFISNDNSAGDNAAEINALAPAGYVPGTARVRDDQGLNGVRIVSDKKIVVLGGTDCTWVGNVQYPGCGACDLTFTQFFPIENWSNSFVTTQTLLRSNNLLPLANNAASSIADYLLIFADQNNTKVTIAGQAAATKTLSAGEMWMYESPGSGLDPLNPGATNHSVKSDKPIMVVQMQKGWQCDNSGTNKDPSQMWVYNEKSWGEDYLLTNPQGASAFVDNFLVLLVNSDSTNRTTAQLIVNGSNVPITSPWVQMGTTPYYYNRVDAIPPGAAMRLRADGPIGFYASGAGGAGSYGFMGGASCTMEVEVADIVTCFGDTTAFEIDTIFGGKAIAEAGEQAPVYEWITGDLANGNPSVFGAIGKYKYTTPGTYNATLKFSDVGGCQSEYDFTVEYLPEFTSEFEVDNQTCIDDSVTVTYLGVAPSSSTFNWDFNGAGVNGSGAGPYKALWSSAGIKTIGLTIDNDKCSSPLITHDIEVIAKPVLSIDVATNPNCFNGNDGSVHLALSGGLAPVMYSVNNGTPQTSDLFSGLKAGLHTFKVVDDFGCFGTTTHTLTNPLKLDLLGYTINSDCGVSNGEIHVDGMGGTPPLLYSIDGGSATTDTFFIGLAGGSHTVQLTDANNCIVSKSFTINSNGGPSVSTTADSDGNLCFGDSLGSVTSTITGGTSPFDVQLVNVDDPSFTVPNNTDGNFANLPAGNYSVVVNDFGGCITSSDFTITQPDGIELVSVTSEDGHCNDATGSITLIAAGGNGVLTYQLDGGTGQLNGEFTDLAEDTYTITVTDESLCSSNFEVSVGNTGLPTVIAIASKVGVCPEEAVTLTANSPTATSYSWTPADNQSNPIGKVSSTTLDSTTTFVVTILDQYGCTAVSDTTVVLYPLPVADAGEDDEVCIGDSTELAASGGVSYSWVPNATLKNANSATPTVTPTKLTEYIVVVTDENGCQASDKVSVDVNGLPNISAGINNPICEGDSVQLQALGGQTYTWSPTTGLDDPNSSTPWAAAPVDSTFTYTITGTDENGCKNTATTTISKLPLAIASAKFREFADKRYSFQGFEELNITKWKWDYGDRSPVDSGRTKFHIYAQDGTFTVTLIVFNECNTDTLQFNIVVDGIADDSTGFVNSVETNLNFNPNDITVYPNPFNSSFNVHILSLDNRNVRFEVYDILGKNVYRELETELVSNSSLTRQIDLNNSTASLNNGVYILHIYIDNELITKKLIRQN